MNIQIKKKPIIILCSIIVFIALLFVFRYPICMTISSLVTPEPEIVQEVKKYVDEYNRSCENGYRVRVTYGYAVGNETDCSFEFEDAKINDADKIMEFFLKFHNEFGYKNLCNSNENSRFLNSENERVEFEFSENDKERSIKLRYDYLIFTYESLDLPGKRVDAFVSICEDSLFDASIIDEFKGNVLLNAYSSSSVKQ